MKKLVSIDYVISSQHDIEKKVDDKIKELNYCFSICEPLPLVIIDATFIQPIAVYED